MSEKAADPPKDPTRPSCSVCENSETTLFFEVENVPVFCNTLWPTRPEALAAPVAPIRLAYCQDCGFIYNVAFDPARMEYSPAYENSLHFSRVFRQWAEETAGRLVRRYQLQDKDIIEIGCGQGQFLGLLQRLGNNRVLGFDPSYDPKKKSTDADERPVKILREPYSEAHGSYPADFICCRHVLEHIAHPLEFLQGIRRAIGLREGSVVYFEAPNALYSFEQMGLWDIIYEHCSYFTSESLANLFNRAGFEPMEIGRHYGDQFLTIEARPARCRAGGSPHQEWAVPNMRQLVADFQHVFQETVRSWRDTLTELHDKNSRIVIWGAGSKGVTFANILGISHQQVGYLVDINPDKHGKYIPATGQEIVAPEFLKHYQPQKIIVMNPIYKQEIHDQLVRMNVIADIIPVQQMNRSL